MTLNIPTDNSVKYTSGPVNTAICVVETENTVDIGYLTSSCVSSFGDDCTSGYVFGFWLFADENLVDKTVEIFQFNEFSIEVDFESAQRQNNTFNFKMVDCATISAVIGIRTYHHYTIMVLAGKSSFQVFIDGQIYKEEACTQTTPAPASQLLKMGGTTKVCVDEFVLSGIADKIYPETYYTKIVKGESLRFENYIRCRLKISKDKGTLHSLEIMFFDENISICFSSHTITGTFIDDPEIKALKTEIKFPVVYVTGPTSNDYLTAFEDVTSESSTFLISMMNDIVSVFTNVPSLSSKQFVSDVISLSIN